MRFNGRQNCNVRRRSFGGAIAETGPALLILLLFIVFPCILFLGLGAQYCCAWYHNHLLIGELSERTAADAGCTSPATGSSTFGPQKTANFGSVGTLIANGFDKTGMVLFSGVTSFTDTVTYYAPVAGAAAVPASAGNPKGTPAVSPEPARVECSTLCTGKPFICIPMFGWTKTTYNIAGEALREVTQ